MLLMRKCVLLCKSKVVVVLNIFISVLFLGWPHCSYQPRIFFSFQRGSNDLVSEAPAVWDMSQHSSDSYLICVPELVNRVLVG